MKIDPDFLNHLKRNSLKGQLAMKDPDAELKANMQRQQKKTSMHAKIRAEVLMKFYPDEFKRYQALRGKRNYRSEPETEEMNAIWNKIFKDNAQVKGMIQFRISRSSAD